MFNFRKKPAELDDKRAVVCATARPCVDGRGANWVRGSAPLRRHVTAAAVAPSRRHATRPDKCDGDNPRVTRPARPSGRRFEISIARPTAAIKTTLMHMLPLINATAPAPMSTPPFYLFRFGLRAARVTSVSGRCRPLTPMDPRQRMTPEDDTRGCRERISTQLQTFNTV